MLMWLSPVPPTGWAAQQGHPVAGRIACWDMELSTHVCTLGHLVTLSLSDAAAFTTLC